jgi:hypothetical protein
LVFIEGAAARLPGSDPNVLELVPKAKAHSRAQFFIGEKCRGYVQTFN